eukprot:CAMPEP_0198683908 /NCGR_PEP_ID=MMETSP1468-20131203/11400_2 /TAXON_ID=1461545 /ORGANISM="Mantoniella sp, Strain CCMP1436" /LENGTH=34 /DNA_ID= /DNA_START= /DNA_END= /DNA_ORIENTATION=
MSTGTHGLLCSGESSAGGGELEPERRELRKLREL